ncbi:type II toxin-antitoxin system VapC family toxin [Pseudoduganella violacea]|uniref:PIN domain-containing protein n=1 Tax=Pseudoduganella violacea TaxID=1715466 RepID=A0A7W5BA32_9BURK|nr:type II toxin-antitoxin system VapC family toxin [Pseudoduganella violacea]MBB3119304.1 hypothetical protein [Pseudoduganella violacea]
MYLLDTNVISEFRKGERSHPGVQRFFARVQDNLIFLPAQVIGEIQAGIARLRRSGSEADKSRADAYTDWLDGLVAQHANRIIGFDSDAARIWGALLSNEKKDPHTIDKQIAALALMHDLTVVTRDKGEAFTRIPGLKVYNPFNDDDPNGNDNSYALAA